MLLVVDSRCSTRVVRLLVDAGADTTSAFRITNTAGGDFVSNITPLDLTHRCLCTKKVDWTDATEEQLHGLEGIRRLLLRVEAVHAVSWLWPDVAPMISRAAEGPKRSKITFTQMGAVVSGLRRRARRKRGVLLTALFR